MIIFRSLTMLVLIVPLGFCQSALGHGFQLSLSGNQLVGTGDDFLEGKTTNPSTFSSAWTNVTASALYNKGSGGVSVSASGGLSLANGDTLSLEFATPLMYSSGGAASPVAPGVGLAFNSYVSSTYTLPNLIGASILSGSLVLPGRLDVSGTTSHSIQWVLSGSPIPAGVYGFAYRVHGENSITPQHLQLQFAARALVKYAGLHRRQFGHGGSGSGLQRGA